jgi:ketosteroid isomerase-like protein
MKKNLLQLVLAGAICACAVALTGHVTAGAADDAKAKELIALDADWSKAAVAKNADKVASYYADDAVAYPPNEPAAVGRAAARKVWGDALATPGYQVSWKTTKANVDGNLGYTAGTYLETSKGADGKTVTGHGKYLCVWRKGADGKWKAIQDMWNSDTK